MQRGLLSRAARAALIPALSCAAGAAGAQSGAVNVSRRGQGAYEASLAAHGGGFAVAWHDTRHGLPEIYARLVDASGRPVADEHRLTTNTDRSYEPSIAAAGARDLIVAWYDVAADDAWSRARVGAWTAAGGVRWTRTLSHPRRRGRAPVVAVHADRIQGVWIEETGDAPPRGAAADSERDPGASDAAGDVGTGAAVWAQRLRLDGEPLGPPRRVARASRTTWNLNLRMDEDGVAWIVFDAQVATRAHELFLAQVDGESATVRRLSADDGVPSVYPDVALGAGRAAVTWFDERDGNADVHLAVVDRDRLPRAIDEGATRVTDTAGASIGAYVAWNGARFGTVTVDYQTADGTATAGADYTAASGTLTFQAGERTKTVSVTLLDDTHDEGEETFTLTLSNASGAVITDGEAMGTIENHDPMPQALLARFGRTAAVHVVEHVEERLQAPREPGFEGRFAGRELRKGMERDMALNFLRQLGGSADMHPAGMGSHTAIAASPTAGTAPLGTPGHGGRGAGTAGGPSGLDGGLNSGGFLHMGLGGGDLLTGSGFAMNRESRGGILSFWSRGAQSRFSGREGALSLGGDVRTDDVRRRLRQGAGGGGGVAVEQPRPGRVRRRRRRPGGIVGNGPPRGWATR